MKKIMMMIVGVVVLVACVGVLFRAHYINSENEAKEKQKLFFGIDGLWQKTIETIEKCKDIFGEPLRVDLRYDDQGDLKYTELVYDNFYIRYFHWYDPTQNEENIQFAHIHITSPDMELWRGHIRIGSTRQEVEKAFGHLRSVEIATNSYYDSWWNVGFYYDEQDVVNGILFFRY